jgi:hypothetical protein
MRGNDGVEVWSDQTLRVSQQWHEEIRDAIERCEVAVLLISANFYLSDFIVKEELSPLLKRESEGKCKIYCLLVSPSAFDGDEVLSRFQCSPSPDKTLLEYQGPKRDRILNSFSKEIRQSLRLRISGGIALNESPNLNTTPISNDEPVDIITQKDIDIYPYFMKQSTSTRASYQTQEESTKAFRDKVFDRCNIHGPAVLFAMEGCSFVNCSFVTEDSDVESLILDGSGAGFNGVLALINCTFRNCNFDDISFVCNYGEVDELRKAISEGMK